MARIRSVKPAFWSDGKIIRLTRDQRLFFIGLWNFVDDAGRAYLDAAELRVQILPGDNDVNDSTIGGYLTALASFGLIQLYAIDGREIVQVMNFGRHQKIDKPQPSNVPPRRTDSTNVRLPFGERSPNDPRTVDDRSTSVRAGEDRRGEEGKGKEGGEEPSDHVHTYTRLAKLGHALNKLHPESWWHRDIRAAHEMGVPLNRIEAALMKPGNKGKKSRALMEELVKASKANPPAPPPTPRKPSWTQEEYEEILRKERERGKLDATKRGKRDVLKLAHELGQKMRIPDKDRIKTEPHR